MFGQFWPKVLHTPQALVDDNEHDILAYPVSCSDRRQDVLPYEDATHWNNLRDSLLDAVFRDSGKPNTATDSISDYQLPPPEFKFFEYILRHHFQARFERRSVGGDDPETSRKSCEFLERNFIFHLDEENVAATLCDEDYHDGSGMLQSIEPPLELTYRRWAY
ncbi:hypothetical protein PG996_016149 [Apiospora saccharicola]|uniref:Uncharacterized protein n=1 Tax=Apiospora saccharicola TaxID=335842 RepID=A0ABR1TN31_9PEZI